MATVFAASMHHHCYRYKGLDTSYITEYFLHKSTWDQHHFTISEVTVDWHELTVPHHIMWPSTAHTNGQLDPLCSYLPNKPQEALNRSNVR